MWWADWRQVLPQSQWVAATETEWASLRQKDMPEEERGLIALMKIISASHPWVWMRCGAKTKQGGAGVKRQQEVMHCSWLRHSKGHGLCMICVCVCLHACVSVRALGESGQKAGGLASTAPMAFWRRVFEALVPVVRHEVDVSLHALIHLLTDDVHKTLKHLLHVDVVLCAGLEELKPWGGGRTWFHFIYYEHTLKYTEIVYACVQYLSAEAKKHKFNNCV